METFQLLRCVPRGLRAEIWYSRRRGQNWATEHRRRKYNHEPLADVETYLTSIPPPPNSLLGIPAEILLEIFRNLFECPLPITINDKHGASRFSQKEKSTWNSFRSLFGTCHHIRKESTEIFFANATVNIGFYCFAKGVESSSFLPPCVNGFGRFWDSGSACFPDMKHYLSKVQDIRIIKLPRLSKENSELLSSRVSDEDDMYTEYECFARWLVDSASRFLENGDRIPLGFVLLRQGRATIGYRSRAFRDATKAV